MCALGFFRILSIPSTHPLVTSTPSTHPTYTRNSHDINLVNSPYNENSQDINPVITTHVECIILMTHCGSDEKK